MADCTPPSSFVARTPLDSYTAALADASHSAVGLGVLPPARQYSIRVHLDSPARHRVESVLGARLPVALSWVEPNDGMTVIWLGPDEWLVLDRSMSAGVERRLQTAMGSHGAIVEQSGQRMSLLVTGDASALLAKGTALQLDPRAFPVGSALQGHLGQAVVLFLSRQVEPARIELLVRSSFARYVADWLLDASADPLAYPAAGAR